MANEVELEKVSKSVFGITSRRYRQMATDEIVPVVVKGKIDFVSASKALIAYYRKLAEGQGSLNLTDVRTRKENARAEREELIVKKLKGELVERDQAERWLHGHVEEATSAFGGLPRRISGELAPILDEKEIEFVLRKEVRKILNDLSNPLKKTKGKAK